MVGAAIVQPRDRALRRRRQRARGGAVRRLSLVNVESDGEEALQEVEAARRPREKKAVADRAARSGVVFWSSEAIDL